MGRKFLSETIIKADMEKNGGFVVEDDGKIIGNFTFLPSPKPTYYNILVVSGLMTQGLIM